MNNIYTKYCNEMQNPALGAYALAMFVNEHNKISKKGKASLIYLFVIMGVFLICSQISNAIIGCVIYVILALLFIVIFMNKTFISCLKEGIGYIKRAKTIIKM